MSLYKVKDKNGVVKPYDRFKAMTGAMRAGASMDEAEKTVQQVESYIFNASHKGPVTYSDVRKQTVRALGNINPIVARIFDTLEKK